MRGTLVERKTGLVILCKMDGCTADAALEGFSRQLKKFPASMRASMTYDRGTEMTCYAELMDRRIWMSGSTIPMRLCNVEVTKTPTAYFASSCPKALTCPWQASNTSITCRG